MGLCCDIDASILKNFFRFPSFICSYLKRMKVLIIETDDALFRKVEKYLRVEGHWSDYLSTPALAAAALGIFSYDAIIYNVADMDSEAQKLLQFLRHSSYGPRTILTVESGEFTGEIRQRCEGILILKKPYSLRELYLSLQAITGTGYRQQDEVITCNELIVDVPGRTVTVKDNRIDLTRKEFDLLCYLMSNRSKVISKNALANYLANAEHTIVSGFGFLYAHMKNLKRKLKVAGCTDYIQTVYGIGYRFEAQ
ncbi:hypothetical protein CK934_19800 [Chitinophaga sp. MD30]|nr:hypothetical protein CK934_19800 [Chitinophaga sp. MD30]